MALLLKYIPDIHLVSSFLGSRLKIENYRVSNPTPLLYQVWVVGLGDRPASQQEFASHSFVDRGGGTHAEN